MVSRIAAGIVAGLFALAAAPAGAQVRVEQKPNQADAIKKLEAEIAKLREVEEQLHARLKALRNEVDRAGAIERIEKSRIERQIEDVKKRAQIEQERARSEFDRAIKLGNDELKRAEIEFDRAAKFRDDKTRLVEEVEKVQRLRQERDKLDKSDKLSQVEREKSKLAQIEQEKPTKLQEERLQIAKDIDRLIELKTSGDKPKVVVLDVGGKTQVAYEKMSAPELKQLIAKLQILLEEKTRTGDKPGTEKAKPYPGKPGLGEEVKPGALPQDEIMKRLDKLSQELEELRRTIKK
jgi:hypothetical protein